MLTCLIQRARQHGDAEYPRVGFCHMVGPMFEALRGRTEIIVDHVRDDEEVKAMKAQPAYPPKKAMTSAPNPLVLKVDHAGQS